MLTSLTAGAVLSMVRESLPADPSEVPSLGVTSTVQVSPFRVSPLGSVAVVDAAHVQRALELGDGVALDLHLLARELLPLRQREPAPRRRRHRLWLWDRTVTAVAPSSSQ